MSDDYRTADDFVSGEQVVPHPVEGAIPVYDDGIPPETVMPASSCPCCGERMPTIYDVWQARRRRDRLVEERNQYEFDDPMWDAYNEGIQYHRKEIDRLLAALPANVSSWVNRVTDRLAREDPFGVNDR